VHHGCHFCRTIHAMCNIYALLTQSVIHEVKQSEDMDKNLTTECANFKFLRLNLLTFSPREHRERAVFRALLSSVPNLEECIMTGSEDDLTEIAGLVSFIP